MVAKVDSLSLSLVDFNLLGLDCILSIYIERCTTLGGVTIRTPNSGHFGASQDGVSAATIMHGDRSTIQDFAACFSEVLQHMCTLDSLLAVESGTGAVGVQGH